LGFLWLAYVIVELQRSLLLEEALPSPDEVEALKRRQRARYLIGERIIPATWYGRNMLLQKYIDEFILTQDCKRRVVMYLCLSFMVMTCGFIRRFSLNLQDAERRSRVLF
jgi:hypothetical protein